MKSVRLRCIATTDTSTTRTKSHKRLVPLALLDSLLLSMLPRRMAVVNTSCKEIYATQQLHRPLPSLNRLGHPDWNYAAFQSEIGTRMKRGSMLNQCYIMVSIDKLLDFLNLIKIPVTPRQKKTLTGSKRLRGFAESTSAYYVTVQLIQPPLSACCLILGTL